MTAPVIDICLATFRRPNVVDTLASLASLDINPSWTVRVIVADNDDAPSARSYVELAAKQYGLSLTYVHAPARNISIARNACLDAANGTHIAFIDDDEIVSSGWLAALMVTHQTTGADMVLGPVDAVYGVDCPEWIRHGDFHSTRPVWVNGDIRTGYMGNALMRRDAQALQGLRFRPDLGQSGGEDTAFCAAYYRAGGRIAYAPNAHVTEPVLPNRTTLTWLLKRRFRYGQIHGLMLREQGNSTIKTIMLAVLKCLFSLGMAIFMLFRPQRARFWTLRAVFHAGVMARLLGHRELQLYKVAS